jgi:hypothetical protein
MISSDLFAYDSEGMPVALDQHPLPAPAIKFAVEDPFPRAKFEPAVGHRHHRYASRPTTCGVQPICAAEVQPVYAARFRCASALSSPVRLCWYWLVGA